VLNCKSACVIYLFPFQCCITRCGGEQLAYCNSYAYELSVLGCAFFLRPISLVSTTDRDRRNEGRSISGDLNILIMLTQKLKLYCKNGETKARIYLHYFGDQSFYTLHSRYIQLFI
jgi:hypothetical protein